MTTIIHPNFIYSEDIYQGNLYKYMSNIEYIKQAISNKCIYMSNPEDFNDPFDGGIILHPEDYLDIHCKPIDFFRICKSFLSQDEILALKKILAETKLYKVKEIIEYLEKETKIKKRYELLLELLHRSQFLLKGKQPIIYDNQLKIACFSKTCESFPMWAHYANNHKGVCLMYDATNVSISKDCDIPSKALSNVQYVTDYRTDNIHDCKQHFYKSKQWEYEQEVRIVCTTREKYLKFPYLKEVYLGINISDADSKEIIECCMNNEVDVLQVQASTAGDYSLDFLKTGNIIAEYKKRGIEYSFQNPKPKISQTIRFRPIKIEPGKSYFYTLEELKPEYIINKDDT